MSDSEFTPDRDATRPLISVILCSCNIRDFIEAAISSVLTQTYSNFELIIIDDASTDGTREWLRHVLRPDHRVKLHFQECNLGSVVTKNNAMAMACGEHFIQCDSDDLYVPDLLARYVDVLRTFPEIRVVACGTTQSIRTKSLIVRNFPSSIPCLRLAQDCSGLSAVLDETDQFFNDCVA